MKVEINPEDIPRIAKALDHFWAYLVGAQREDRAYERLAEQFRRMVDHS